MIAPEKKESKFDIEDIKSLEDLGRSHWSVIFDEATEDIKFSYSTGKEQWNPEALLGRGGRPAETYNIINGFVRPIVNLIRENPPAINVYPISDGASKTNARHLSGIIRAIEYGCGAQREFCDAMESAVRCGLGILRLIPKQSDLGDNDVEFVISNVTDPTQVIIDPSAIKADYSDAQWVIVKSTMSERQYHRDYPEGNAQSIDGIVEISELWIKEIKRVKTTDEITNTKKVKSNVKILQYIYDDIEILEVIDNYPGKYLPFAVVSGPKYTADGIAHLQSITREIKGVQKEINFLKSEMISSIACAPKNTYFGDNNAFDNEEELRAWEESAIHPKVFLGHKPGATIQQTKQPEIPTAYIESVDKNIDIARVITGIYPDPTIQNGLNAVSGKAIKQQQAGQSIATYAFVDSLNYAVKHIGEVLLDLLPYYWNDDQVRLAMGIDGQYTSVSMGPTEVPDASNFDLAYGKYQVSIDVGPSYANQKDALIEMVMDCVKTNPQAMQIALPWLINNVNLPGSEELADMFSLLLPANIQQFIAQQKGQSQSPEDKLKAAFMQLQKLQGESQQKDQMVDQLTQALQNETEQLKSKDQELQMKKQMADDSNHMALLIADMKLNHEKEMQDIKTRLETLKILSDKQKVEDQASFKQSENEQLHQHNLEDIVVSKSLESNNAK